MDLANVLHDDRKIAAWSIAEDYLDPEHDIHEMVVAHESSFLSPRSVEGCRIVLEEVAILLIGGEHGKNIGSLSLARLSINDQSQEGWELRWGVVCRYGNIDNPVFIQPKNTPI